MSKKLPHHQTAGFSLIEMLVSLALFTIVITIAVGALLSLISTSTEVQGQQNVMTTLTFAMDSMSREIRTGKQYVCGAFTFVNQESLSTSANSDCYQGANGVSPHGISFIEGGDSVTKSESAKRIAYYYNDTTHKIMRRVGGATAESITSDGISISRADFFVTGSQSLSASGNTNIEQPTVTIVIEATETGSATNKPFVLETTITQRELDL